MDERVRTSQEFIQLVQTKGRSVLDRIITMDESAVSMHTPETKQQSKQWLKKEWEGVLRGVSKDDFAKAFVRWYERCEKCIRVNGSYVEKS
jgi:hypothetical protein